MTAGGEWDERVGGIWGGGGGGMKGQIGGRGKAEGGGGGFGEISGDTQMLESGHAHLHKWWTRPRVRCSGLRCRKYLNHK